MKIINNLKIEIPDTNTYYFDLQDYSIENSDTVLIYGYDTLENPPEILNKYKIKKYLNVTMPTEFLSDQDIFLDDRFDKIYSICPYSCDWLNKIKNTNKYEFIWYPFNKKYIPSKTEKKYDVCYHGGIHGIKHIEMLDIIKNFNYRYMSMTNGINFLTINKLNYATDLDLKNIEKLLRVSESKISICYHNLPCYPHHVDNIKAKINWQTNECFNQIGITNDIPQLKSRFIEASLCRTLNLVEKDNWNIIEKLYTPNEHFIYFENNNDLADKIETIINNYEDYVEIIEKSFWHSYNNYCTDSLIKKINK